MTEQLPPDVIAQLKALDPEITPQLAQASWAVLTPFHEKAGYTAPKIDRDLAYGGDPRHRLDVHTAGTEEGAPVFVFVHGGGFVRGDKHNPGTPQYDLVGAWAVRRGYVGVTMTYRLAPEHRWPSGAEDVAKAVQWLRQHIAAYGGDPDKIVVAGNSAGAVHVASFVAGQGKAAGGADPRSVAGAAMLSGSYEIGTPQPGAPEHAYYGPDPDPAIVSALPGLLQSPVPLLFSVAERDPRFFQEAAARLVSAWLDRHGTVPDLVWVEGHNHMSTIASLTIDEPALGAALARFTDRHTSTTDKETAQ